MTIHSISDTPSPTNAILFSPPQISTGILGNGQESWEIHRNRQEFAQEWTGMDWNSQELTKMDWNPQELP